MVIPKIDGSKICPKNQIKFCVNTELQPVEDFDEVEADLDETKSST
jgi:hypothetical protein